MAAAFFGYTLLVTLRQPPNCQVKGTVVGVVEQKELTLKDVTLMWNGTKVPIYRIQAAGIQDLEIVEEPQAPGLHNANANSMAPSAQVPQVPRMPGQPPPPPQQQFPQRQQHMPPPPMQQQYAHRPPPAQMPAPAAAPAPITPVKAPQPFVDPAILSFQKPAAVHSPAVSTAAESTIIGNTGLPNAASVPPPLVAVRSALKLHEPAERRDSTSTAILVEPFDHMALKEGRPALGLQGQKMLSTETLRQGEGSGSIPQQVSEQSGTPAKRSRNKKSSRLRKEEEIITDQSAAHPRGKGWRQTAFVEDARAAKGRRSKNKRSNMYAEDANGWATEDATDIQELGDFDFVTNLGKFDKRRVFDEIRNEDTTADEDRLVSFNRKVRPGTNGGKNLHYTENVLDSTPLVHSPTVKNEQWASEAGETTTETDEDPAGEHYSSGPNSRRARSRVSARQPAAAVAAAVSRKGSTLVERSHKVAVAAPIHPNASHAQYSSSRTGSPMPAGVNKPPPAPTNAPTLRLTSTQRICPTVSPLQVLEIEQLAIAELGLTEDIITENAGRSLAEATLMEAPESAFTSQSPFILVLAGNHRTASRAVCAARHFRNRGYHVHVCVLGGHREAELLESVRKQLDTFKKSGGRVSRWEELQSRLVTGEFKPDIVIDALFGIHVGWLDLTTEDQASVWEMVTWLNSREHIANTSGPNNNGTSNTANTTQTSKTGPTVVSVDVPTGLDASSGEITVPDTTNPNITLCVRANHIVSLGAPKTGLLAALTAGTLSTGVDEGEARFKLSAADLGINQASWKKYGSRRRYGVEFGRKWVVELKFVV